MLNGSLRPYLAYSATGHGLVVLALGLAMSAAPSQPGKVYRIDFIGSTPEIINREQGGPAAAVKPAPPPVQAPAAKRPPPQTDPDAFNMKRRPQAPLPRPSLLPETAKPPAAKPPKEAPRPETAPPAARAAAVQAPADSGSGPSEGPGTTVSADMPDFPYPWYITRVRSALWDKWSADMPSGEGECTVVFSIMRSGKLVDLRVELSSGDSAYDYKALSSARDASPFPPLPDGFPDSFLRIHVRFTSR